MELRVLGCSGGEANGERLTTLLINGTLAIDAGSLTQALTVEEQTQIRHIFLTHSHLDHICTLPFYAKNILGKIQGSAVIYALPETLDMLRCHLFNDALWPDFTVLPTPDNPVLRYVAIEPEKVYEVDGLRVTPIAVNHLVPCVGYRVEDQYSAFIFTADTAATERIYAVANETPNLKLFITEVSFPNYLQALADASFHLTTAALEQELKKLKVDVPVAISHISPGDKQQVLDELRELHNPQVQLLLQGARMVF